MLDAVICWAWLPTGILHLIFSHSGAWNLRRVRQVCKNWRGAANRATHRLTASPKHMFPLELLLPHFSNITFLNLTCDWVNRGSLYNDVSAGLQIVSTLPKLTSLSLSGWTDLTDEHSVVFPTMMRLEDLDLSFCSGLDVGLVYISEMLNLKSLVLASCSSMTDQGFSLLSKLSGLKKLVLSGTGIGNKGLSTLTTLKGLNILDLMECGHVGDLGIIVLLPSLTNLVELNLRECSDVSGQGLEVIIAEKLEIMRLMIEGCERVRSSVYSFFFVIYCSQIFCYLL